MSILVTFLSNSLSTEEDQIRFVLCLFSCYPISLLNYKLKTPILRLLLGLITGLLLQYFMFGYTIYHVIIGALVTHLFLVFFGRKVSGFFLLAFVFLHLTFINIKRMVDDYGGWRIDTSVIYMMSLVKFSSLVFSYEDGGKQDSELKCSYHRKKKVIELPTLLETLSFTFYFPTSICGPAIEFADFISFIRLEKEYLNIPKSKAIKESMEDLLISVGMMVAKVIFTPFFYPAYLLTDEFYYKNFVYKFFCIYFTMTILRIKYYIGWKMAQSAVTHCGLSYNPKIVENQQGDEKNNEVIDSFDKYENCSLTKIELELNPKIKIQYWNRSVHLWLKYNIYIRIINIDHKLFKGKDSTASLVTFILSAIWHGFYPMYYVFFFEFWLLEQSCTMLEKKLNFWEKLEKSHFIIQQIVLCIIMNLMNVLGLQFCLLLFSSNYIMCRNLYFIPNIFIVIMYVILAFFVKSKRMTKNREDDNLKNNIVSNGEIKKNE